MITVIELNQKKEELVGKMKNVFSKFGFIEPMAVIICQDGKAFIMETPFSNEQEKQIIMAGVKALCRKFNAAAVAIINEAWVVEFDKEKFNQKDAEDMIKHVGGVKNMPKRKECAICCFETLYEQEMITFGIDRNGRVLTDEQRTTNVSGNFSNILSPVIKN